MKKIIEKIKSLDKNMLIRNALLVLAFVNQAIAVFAVAPFVTAPIYQFISIACTVLISALNAWKNNDYTHLAILAGQVLQALKDKKLDEKEITELLEKAKKYSDTN